MKKILLAILIFAMSLSLFAVPGTTQYIEDTPGEYVYYRDFSFTRESYIGLLAYDDSIYQIRYYAPADEAAFLPEKSISILVAVDPDSEYWNMTGETVVDGSQINAEDMDILNYLQDIMYEFSSRRIKAEIVSPEDSEYKTDGSLQENGVRIKQEYAQFGGNVAITFDALIPIFNIKSITALDGTDLLHCATIGRIYSSGDTSFEDFKGFNKTASLELSKNFKNKSKSKKITTKLNQQFTIDSNWTEQADFLWTMDNEAVLSISAIPITNQDKVKENYTLLRALLETTDGSYIDFNNAEILENKKGNYYRITSDIYQKSGNVTRDTKILEKENPEAKKYFSLAVFKDPYLQREKYYEKIIRSYKF